MMRTDTPPDCAKVTPSAIVASAMVGCGGAAPEIKADANKGGQKLDAAKQADVMAESIKHAPPEMRAKMEAQMEMMKKAQEGNPATRGKK